MDKVLDHWRSTTLPNLVCSITSSIMSKFMGHSVVTPFQVSNTAATERLKKIIKTQVEVAYVAIGFFVLEVLNSCEGIRFNYDL